MKLRWAFLVVTGLLGWCLWLVNLSGAASIAAPAHTATITDPGGDYKGPFVTMKVPTWCSSTAANTRYYTTAIPDGDTYMRSGEHNHGNRIHCIFFGTGSSYGKWLVFNQATGGWLITGTNGLDVTYVDCAPPLRFPNPPNATTPNDCAESWGTGEGGWVFTTGPNIGQAMIPGSTP